MRVAQRQHSRNVLRKLLWGWYNTVQVSWKNLEEDKLKVRSNTSLDNFVKKKRSTI
jgi:hypothetical protein